VSIYPVVAVWYGDRISVTSTNRMIDAQRPSSAAATK